MTDYEIAKSKNIKNILDITKEYLLDEKDIMLYGSDKAKITSIPKKNKLGKLILVTSVNPTPYGEGKTTLSIGIHDTLCSLKKKSVVVLREPSLGPVFGTKGGATGGGMSQIVPMDDINLHFTGDMHAITSANNLLAAIIDNHIFSGNELEIDQVCFERCLDINDRALRNISLKNRQDQFNITPASEIMAILCLSKDMNDLKHNLGNIVIGYNKNGKEIYACDLDCVDALAILLKDAIHPNLVQTLENNLAIVHGGPFANIAHGCSSIRSIQLGLNIADYVITEAGFGSDMGGIKFFDITCRKGGFFPNLVVVNTTIRSLKYNGNNQSDLETGICNLEFHIQNMKRLCDNVLVVLNKFEDDSEKDISFVEQYCLNLGVSFEISTCYKEGSKGGISIVKRMEEMLEKKVESNILYPLDINLKQKIEIIVKDYLHAKNIIYSDRALQKIELLQQGSLSNLPICIAKTQYSISDNAKLLGNPKDFEVTITDIKLNNGAGFITIYMGNIITMPGLSKKANYVNMKYDGEKIEGLF